MKRVLFPLFCMFLVGAIYWTEGFKNWFAYGPPKMAEPYNDIAAIEKSWRIDTQTKEKLKSLQVSIRIQTASGCKPAQFGYIDKSGKILTLCPRLTQLQQSIEIAHLVDHAVRMSDPSVDQTKNDAYGLISECNALRELVYDGTAHFPICRESERDIVNGKFDLGNPLNKVLERLPILETTISAQNTP